MAKVELDIPDEALGAAAKLMPGLGPTLPAVAAAEAMPQPEQVDETGAAAVSDFTEQVASDAADPFAQAMRETNLQLEDELNAASKKTAEERGVMGGVLDTLDSVGTGVITGGFNTWNTLGDLIGMPPANEEDRWGIENEANRAKRELERRGGANGAVLGISEFVTGLIGVGKVMDALKVTQFVAKGGLLTKGAFEIGKGGVAAGMAMDPNGQRLSDLIESVPELRNPVTQFLASDPTDSNAEGRLKNALEGAGLDLLAASVLSAAVKVYRAASKATVARNAGGDGAAEMAELAQAEAELAEQVAVAKGTGADGQATLPQTIGGSPARIIDEALAAKQAGEADQLAAQPGRDPIVKDLVDDLREPEGPRITTPTSNIIDDAMREGQAGKGTVEPPLKPEPVAFDREAALRQAQEISDRVNAASDRNLGGATGTRPDDAEIALRDALVEASSKSAAVGPVTKQNIEWALNNGRPDLAQEIVRKITEAATKTKPGTKSKQVYDDFIASLPDTVKAPDVQITVKGGNKAPKDPVAESIVTRAKEMGLKPKRQKGSVKDIPIPDGPKIETNGIKYSVIPQQQMAAIGKAYGIDSSTWLGSANQSTGEIFISDAILKLPLKRQQEIIMHETAHILEGQFVKALSGREGRLKTIPPALKAEMEAASRELRPEHWGRRDDVAAPTHKADDDYLNHPAELFADAFAIWKTNPERFAELAPQTGKLFDQHFMPWKDHDFTTHAGDVAEATDAVLARRTLTAPGKSGTPVYADVQKAKATVEQYQPEVMVSYGTADDLAEGYLKDAEALAQYGSKVAAEAAGYRFSKSGNLPYQKLATSEDLQQFLARTAAKFKDKLDDMKLEDVLTDKRVEQLIAQRVELFNEDPAMVMGQLQAAGRNANAMIANMEAAFAVANKAAIDLTTLVKNNKMGNYAEFKGDANAAEAALPARMALYVEALGAAQAMRSAAGRAMRRMRGDFQLDEAGLQQIRTMNPEDAAQIIEMAGGDMKMLSKLATRGFWDRFVRGAGSLFSNNLLWLWPSHVANTISNGFMLGISPAMRAVGSFALREGGQTVRQQALREYRYYLTAFDDARKTMVSAYLKGDGVLDPYQNEFFRDTAGIPQVGAAGQIANSIGFKKMETIGDVFQNSFKALGFIFSQPNRLLGSSDEFFKQMTYRAAVLSKASIDADDLGLAGKSYADFLKRELDKSFTPDGRAINKDALYDAEVRTFSQPLLPGTVGKWVAGGVSQFPVFRFVLPFVRTPINLLRMSTKWLPGINMLQKEYREMITGKLGPKRQADAFGQMAMGVTLATVGTMLARDGLITGGGPTDPQRRKALSDTGWKPYSIRLNNPDGSHTFVPLNRFDPTGMTLSLIGDVAQAMESGDATDATLDQIIGPMLLAMSKTFANRTYLQSINDAMDALSDPDASMERWAGSVLSSAVPASSLLRQVNPDPYLRDARGIMDTVLAGLPGFSDKLPMRRDYAGEPITRVTNLVFTDKAADVADAEQQRLLVNYGVGLTPLMATERGGVDLRKFTLASTGRSAFERYTELISHPAGAPKSLKEALGELILSPRYERLQDAGDGKGTKLYALTELRNKYRDAAYKQLLRENKDLAGATGMQQQAMREAGRKKDQQVAQGAATKAATTEQTLRNANAAFGAN